MQITASQKAKLTLLWQMSHVRVCVWVLIRLQQLVEYFENWFYLGFVFSIYMIWSYTDARVLRSPSSHFN